MSATNNFENEIMKHLFTNDDLPNIGDATGLVGSTTAGSYYLSLYSDDPGESGAGTELSYDGYARVEIPRTGTSITISGADATNATILNFGQNVGVSSQTANNWAIFTASTSGDMIFYGDVTIPLAVDVGVVPSVPVGSLAITAN